MTSQDGTMKFVESFVAALEAYCRRELKKWQQKGALTSFRVTWSSGPFWCRMRNLGCEGVVDGEDVCLPWEDWFTVSKLPIQEIGALIEEYPEEEPSLIGAYTEMSLLSDEDGGDESPEGELGYWIMLMVDEAIFDLSTRLRADPDFAGLDFSIEGHDLDGPYGHDFYLGPIFDDERAASGHIPKREFLSRFFELLTSNAAWRARLLDLANAEGATEGDAALLSLGVERFMASWRSTWPQAMDDLEMEPGGRVDPTRCLVYRRASEYATPTSINFGWGNDLFIHECRPARDPLQDRSPWIPDRVSQLRQWSLLRDWFSGIVAKPTPAQKLALVDVLTLVVEIEVLGQWSEVVAAMRERGWKLPTNLPPVLTRDGNERLAPRDLEGELRQAVAATGVPPQELARLLYETEAARAAFLSWSA